MKLATPLALKILRSTLRTQPQRDVFGAYCEILEKLSHTTNVQGKRYVLRVEEAREAIELLSDETLKLTAGFISETRVTPHTHAEYRRNVVIAEHTVEDGDDHGCAIILDRMVDDTPEEFEPWIALVRSLYPTISRPFDNDRKYDVPAIETVQLIDGLMTYPNYESLSTLQRHSLAQAARTISIADFGTIPKPLVYETGNKGHQRIVITDESLRDYLTTKDMEDPMHRSMVNWKIRDHRTADPAALKELLKQ